MEYFPANSEGDGTLSPGSNAPPEAALSLTQSVAPALSDVLRMAGRAVGADLSQIYLSDEEHRTLVLSGSIPDGLQALGVPQSAVTLLEKAIESAAPLRLNRSELGPDWGQTRVSAALFLPLIWDGTSLGGMAFYWLDEGIGKGEGSLDMGALLAPQIALSIENARLRKALDEARAQLVGQVQELISTIQQAQQEARESSEQSVLFGQRLRTPLTTLEIYLGLICSHPEQAAAYAEVLSREIKRLQSMVEEMLTLGQARVARVEPDRTAVDLSVLVREVVSSTETLTRAKGQNLRLRVDPTCPLVNGDLEMLKQAVTNLLSNAVQYTPRGGSIGLTVEPRFEQGRAWATIAVEDSGYGMSREELGRVFEAFFRGRAAKISEVAGMGLGLTISKKVINTHGGRIEVQSSVGEGSVFTIWLPASAISVQILSKSSEKSLNEHDPHRP